MTYSIIGRVRATGQVGGAVQSAWYAAAGILTVEVGVGAVASQAIGDPGFGPRGVELLAGGLAPAGVVAELVGGDATPAVRQLAVIDLAAPAAVHTGAGCVPDAGHATGVDCSAQANMMRAPGVPEAMVTAFEGTAGDVAARLLAALDAAEALGGDFRGTQSAGLVVRAGGRGTPAYRSVVVDVRVDDHTEPLAELHRLATLSRAYQGLHRPMELAAAGDHAAAVEAARALCDQLPHDLNARLRLGIALALAGDPEGPLVLAAMVETSSRWLGYIRALCVRYGIDPTPLVGPSLGNTG